ncbi:DUF4253 domain-containing protein [Streptomyces griseoviridis]|jgi:hypothetical protein|uniref:DUF4253 domain-containing protein n=1 Tax=Streptomyces griseoviridis TaxID=45398 RepID=A0A918GR22_STRGD|nr:DUF4253 domain-containing protein [Streptomyces niveoruber]GGS54224.1 hypothetical protein GCM10010238_49490 [Streptomyces niveoruber]
MATLPNPLPGLATDPSGRSLGLRLPPGRLIDTTVDGPWPEPLLWHAGQSASPGTWAALGGPARRAGLLPVLVDLGDGGPAAWELAPAEMSYPGDHDARELLAEYAERVGAVGTTGDGERPGPAPAATLTADPARRAAETADALAESRAPLARPHLALVPARRSADIPAAIGWGGPADEDTGRLGAVLRSWEDRFGIRVVALGYAHLLLSVAAPPTTPAHARAVAAEHLALSPDTVHQGGAVSLDAYAEQHVLDRTSWHFWWE